MVKFSSGAFAETNGPCIFFLWAVGCVVPLGQNWIIMADFQFKPNPIGLLGVLYDQGEVDSTPLKNNVPLKLGPPNLAQKKTLPRSAPVSNWMVVASCMTSL